MCRKVILLWYRGWPQQWSLSVAYKLCNHRVISPVALSLVTTSITETQPPPFILLTVVIKSVSYFMCHHSSNSTIIHCSKKKGQKWLLGWTIPLIGFKLQKRAARVILNADTKANSVQLFRKLDWVPFYHEANVNRLSMVYKRLSGDCPYYLSQILIRNADINERPSRHGLLNLVCPRFKRESEGGRSFSVSTTRLWNRIPLYIRNKPSLVGFKKAIFDFFKDSYKDLDH